MTQQHIPALKTFYLEYDRECKAWCLCQHTPGEPERVLALFCDGTPDGSQLAALVLDLLTIGGQVIDHFEAQGTDVHLVAKGGNVIQDKRDIS